MKFFALDTETQNGKAFLACVHQEEDKAFDVLINSKADVIKLFNRLHSVARIGFCYNLEYDSCALLKYFGYQAIIDLYLQKTLCYDNLFIRAIPSKFLIVTKYYKRSKELSFDQILSLINISKSKLEEFKEDGFVSDRIINTINEFNKFASKSEKIQQKTLHLFDIWQFYEMSLNKAAETHLGKKKKEIPLAWMKCLKTMFEKSKSRRNKIIRYCRWDTQLTYELAAKFIKMLEDCDIRPRYFYSAAYIAKNFIKKNVDVPIINEDYDGGNGIHILKFMSNVFRGGRVEVFKRGSFKEAYLSDMNSAYGYALAELKQIYHVELSDKIAKTADYYFVDCELDIPINYLNAVPVFLKMWKFPYGKVRVTIDNRTLDNAMKAGAKVIKVFKVLNVYCEESYPFKKIINQMFSQRRKSDSHNYVFKRIIVSYVGKLHEQKTFIRLLSEDEKPKVLQNIEQYGKMQEDFESIIRDNCTRCYSMGHVLSTCRNEVCVEFRKEYRNVAEPPSIHYQGDNIFATEKKLGNGTNIIYAALVTSTVRNMIYEKGVELKDGLIAFLTDGILSKTPLEKYGKRLGEFSLKYKGPLYLIGSGMYQTSKNVKFRGFNSEKINLMKLSEKYASKKVMKIPILERTGLGRAVKSLSKFNDFNILKPSTKDLDVNFDKNRMWERDFKNYGEALKSNINSLPASL